MPSNIKQAMTGAVLLASVLLVGCDQPRPRSDYSNEQALHDSWYDATDRAPTPNTLYTMAKILSDQGKNEEAVYVLQSIIRDHPAYLPAYVELAEAQMKMRHTQQAIDTLAKGLQLAPRDAVLLNNMGMVHLITGEHGEAMEFFRLASANEPDNVRYRANMAMALGLMGRYDESLAAYQQVVNECDAHYNVAVICEARQDAQRAQYEYALAEQLRKTPTDKARRPVLGVPQYKPEPVQAMDAPTE